MKHIILPFLMMMMVENDGCDNHSIDQQQSARTEAMASQADQQVGMPGITQFTERRIVRKLYELRDKNAVTYSYVPDMQGRLFHLCDSIGYGLPYGVQFTNPERKVDMRDMSMPQPEPNGLFMPPGADGTWVICASKEGDFQPVYVEPRVIVSPFKLRAEGEYQLQK